MSEIAGMAVGMGRALAESLMVDTCTISDVTGSTEDPETGVVTDLLTPVYSGPCKVQALAPQERSPEVAGGEVTVQRYAVHVPVGSFRPAVGQLVVIVSARLDPYLAGRKYRVVGPLHATAKTAYRLAVEEI